MDFHTSYPLPTFALELLAAQRNVGLYFFTTAGDRPISGFGKAKARLDTLALNAMPENAEPGKLLIPVQRDERMTVTARGHAPFAPIDENRLIAIRHGDTIGRLRIVQVISPLQVRAEVEASLGDTTPTAAWRVGLRHWTTHDLRRTAATGMGRLGIPRLSRTGCSIT
jgi:hypothetical protein